MSPSGSAVACRRHVGGVAWRPAAFRSTVLVGRLGDRTGPTQRQITSGTAGSAFGAGVDARSNAITAATARSIVGQTLLVSPNACYHCSANSANARRVAGFRPCVPMHCCICCTAVLALAPTDGNEQCTSPLCRGCQCRTPGSVRPDRPGACQIPPASTRSCVRVDVVFSTPAVSRDLAGEAAGNVGFQKAA
jgi:hypothetical protein